MRPPPFRLRRSMCKHCNRRPASSPGHSYCCRACYNEAHGLEKIEHEPGCNLRTCAAMEKIRENALQFLESGNPMPESASRWMARIEGIRAEVSTQAARFQALIREGRHESELALLTFGRNTPRTLHGSDLRSVSVGRRRWDHSGRTTEASGLRTH